MLHCLYKSQIPIKLNEISGFKSLASNDKTFVYLNGRRYLGDPLPVDLWELSFGTLCSVY